MVFLDVCYCILIRLQYSINIAFMCIGKPKIPCDFLYNDNLIVVVWSQSLWGMPVRGIWVSRNKPISLWSVDFLKRIPRPFNGGENGLFNKCFLGKYISICEIMNLDHYLTHHMDHLPKWKLKTINSCWRREIRTSCDFGLGSPLRHDSKSTSDKPTDKLDFTEIKSFCTSKDIKKGQRNPQNCRDFPGVPVVTLPCFHCRGNGFNPWSGNWDPTCHVVQSKIKRIGEDI